MHHWKGRVAPVTGASVGIGAEIAKSLVQHGMKVVGCARNLQQIEKLVTECVSSGFSGTLIPYKCDLSVEEQIISMVTWIKAQIQGINVCINNAGLALPEPILSGRTSGWRTMIDVNVIGLSVCTREAYLSMKERNVVDGHIININSLCGHRFMNVTDIHFYSATKYATQRAYGKSYWNPRHTYVPHISSGIVEAEFTYRLLSHDPGKAAATYKSIKCLEADDIAIAVMYVLSAPPLVQIGELQMLPVEQM